MKYPKEYLDEIKTRLKVSTVVSKSVALKKRGKEYVGLSPFKTEKTPSFTVNDEKEFYHCFATSEHGNIFDFIMKTQNLKFGEAVKSLANLAGMKPYTFSKQDEEREKKLKEYLSIYSQYVDFYHDELLKNKTNSNARDYLKNRSLGKEEVKKFKIGYIKKNPNFFDKLKDEFSEQALVESGLFYLDEKKKIYLERFRSRLIFPINNISGQPIALGGRIIEKLDYLAKYINSPETAFFKKGSNLYNLDLARKLSNKIDHVYLVEGYMDVVGLSKNGIENVVANLGTSLTDRQISILNQFFNDIIVSFDGDESGYKAALRAAENSIKELQPEKQISFIFLPDGEDPDSYVNKNGKANFIDFTKQAKISIHQFIFNHYKQQTENNPSSMAIFEKKLRSIAATIKDDFIKKYVLEFFLEKISLLTPHSNVGKKNFYTKKIKSLQSTQKYFNESKLISGVELKEFSLLYLIMNNLSIFQENIHMIENIKLFSDDNKLIFETLITKLKSSEKFTLQEIPIDPQLTEKIFKFASIKHILSGHQNDQDKMFELLEEVSRDLKNYDLEFRIEELESKFSKDLSESTFNEIRELKKQKNIN
ncbi:DNA primase [Candidatus Pelagibacter ubique]|uniref:DNA primase n=1 Tax=Pelagibacter ubique TaxID=198252 RepID=A0ABX1T4E4_PELUQ|nr:DNA primase [Candidatus Pelagibacter ubique]NMN67575.1 DNA primase [Candidatus Pelagibacter ubique]